MRRWRGLPLALLVWFCCQHGAAAAPPAGGDKSRNVAQKVYLQGVDHYKAGRLAEALAAFRASYDMVPSPNSHLMIARTLRDRGELVEAYDEYAKVVSEAEEAAQRDARYTLAAEASRAERAKLRARLTMITIQVKNPPDDLRLTIGGHPIDRGQWGKPVPVTSGALVALAIAAGRPEQRQELVAVPGGELVVSFDFAAPSQGLAGVPSPLPDKKVDAIPDIPRQPSRAHPGAPDRTWGYVSLGVGAAGFVTFAIFGAINQSTFNDLQSTCPNGHCPTDRSDDVDKGRRAQVIANIGLATGVVGGTLGFILLATGGTPEKSDELARRPRGLVVTDLSVGVGAVRVRGVF